VSGILNFEDLRIEVKIQTEKVDARRRSGRAAAGNFIKSLVKYFRLMISRFLFFYSVEREIVNGLQT
jgi:hypothetical protein